MMTPGVTPHEEYKYEGFDELVERIVKARKTVIPSYGVWARTLLKTAFHAMS